MLVKSEARGNTLCLESGEKIKQAGQRVLLGMSGVVMPTTRDKITHL